jgi:hypothetical protein
LVARGKQATTDTEKSRDTTTSYEEETASTPSMKKARHKPTRTTLQVKVNDYTTSLVARDKQAATTSVITTKMNTSQNAAKKSPRLMMQNRKLISLQSNSFLDIDVMADLSWNKRKLSKHEDELSFHDGDSIDTKHSKHIGFV